MPKPDPDGRSSNSKTADVSLADGLAAVPWYPGADQYEQFRSAAVDPEVFFETFQEWLRVAVDHEFRAAEFGVVIIRIRMILEEFSPWASAHGCVNDHSGRSAYADARASWSLGGNTQ